MCDAVHKSPVDVFLQVKTGQLVAQDVTLRRNNHHQSRCQRVDVKISESDEGHTGDLVNVGDLVVGWHFGVIRVPRQERQTILFDWAVQDRINPPEEDCEESHEAKKTVDCLPKTYSPLNQHFLLLISGFEHVHIDVNKNLLESRHVRHHGVGFDDGDQVGQRHENRGRDGGHIVEDEEDVEGLEEVVAVDEEKDAGGGVEGVDVRGVGPTKRPHPCNLQHEEVGPHGCDPIEFLHFGNTTGLDFSPGINL